MTVGEAICIKDWHIEAENGDRQECKRGQMYTITQPQDGKENVTLFSSYWVKAPASIFAGWVSLYDKRCAVDNRSDKV
jgi:hypothetical protein